MDINKLLEPYKKDEELKERTFNTIMKKVHNKIYFASSNRSMETIFEVPVVVFGSPLYNTKEACAYIMVKLLNEGFYVKYIQKNTILISWNEYKKASIYEKTLMELNKLDNKTAEQLEDRKIIREIISKSSFSAK